jgi:hypothetical protein
MFVLKIKGVEQSERARAIKSMAAAGTFVLLLLLEMGDCQEISPERKMQAICHHYILHFDWFCGYCVGERFFCDSSQCTHTAAKMAVIESANVTSGSNIQI